MVKRILALSLLQASLVLAGMSCGGTDDTRLMDMRLIKCCSKFFGGYSLYDAAGDCPFLDYSVDVGHCGCKNNTISSCS